MKWNGKKTTELCEAILSLETTDEVKSFLRDLMTEEEIIECAQRWNVARLLDKQVSYENIQKQTGLSSRTIARISLWLHSGMNGYRLIIDRLNHHITIS